MVTEFSESQNITTHTVAQCDISVFNDQTNIIQFYPKFMKVTQNHHTPEIDCRRETTQAED